MLHVPQCSLVAQLQNGDETVGVVEGEHLSALFHTMGGADRLMRNETLAIALYHVLRCRRPTCVSQRRALIRMMRGLAPFVDRALAYNLIRFQRRP